MAKALSVMARKASMAERQRHQRCAASKEAKIIEAYHKASKKMAAYRRERNGGGGANVKAKRSGVKIGVAASAAARGGIARRNEIGGGENERQ